MNKTDIFLNGLFQIIVNEVPNSVLNHAKRCFFDYLACAIAGANLAQFKETEIIKAFQLEQGNHFVFGTKRKTTLLNAALLNGISAHYIELDDGHRYGMMHPGAPIFSALLAINESYKLSTDDFLRAAIIGYEVAIRLACAVQPGNKLKGYHATGTCGTVGVAMAVATALHFDKEQMKSAFSAATTSAAGLLEMIVGDSEMKPYNIGRAAMDGIMSAFVGKARFKAPEDALGGKRGFLKVMTDEPNLRYVTDFNDGHYAIEGIYRKPYAACRHLHPAIEGGLSIAQEDSFDWRKIKSIIVKTYHLAVFGHDHQVINGINSAKMSIPYSVAVSLIKGSANMESFSGAAIKDSDVLTLAQKVTIIDDDELTALCPGKRVSIISVIMEDETVFEKRVDYPKGEPENPITDIELQQKFKSLALFGSLSETEINDVIQEFGKQDFSINKVIEIISNL